MAKKKHKHRGGIMGCSGIPYAQRLKMKHQTDIVDCRSCEARTQRFALRDFGCSSYSEEANHKAIEAWNRRAEDGK